MNKAQDGEQDQRGDPALDLFESKLQPPAMRTALVSRPALVDRLDSSDVSITVVAAPPGYGKTTLLAEWSQRHPSRVAWLSIDRHDNDLTRLMHYTVAALERVEPIASESVRRPAGRHSVAAAASRVAGAMSEMKEPAVLVLDHVESLQNDDCLDTIAELALHLPPGSRLVLGTRADPPLPMARLRAGGNVVEIGVDDLAMNETEARLLLDGAGVKLTDVEMSRLLDRTEGWPVGLYLAALALNAGTPHDRAGIPFAGDDRLMADYLRTEVLGRRSIEEVTFLTRTSVLDRMSGQLCDAVLERTGSGAVLELLAQSNLLLVALDRQGEWYRYHHLFHDLLRAELQRREPAIVAPLHVRAAEWCEAHRMPELAIDHAQAGGEPDQVNRLMLLHAQKQFASGHGATLARWFEWFAQQGVVERYPAVAALGAHFYTNIGDAGAAERWGLAAEQASSLPDATAAARAAPERVLPDGSTLGSYGAILRVLQCRSGIAAMRADAQIALDELGPTSGYRCAALLLYGLSILLEDDPDRADPFFAQAVDVGVAAGVGPGVVFALAERGFCAINRGDWAAVETFTEEACTTIELFALDEYSESALVFTLAARAAIHRGDLEQARKEALRAARVRPLLTYARPTLSAQTLIELARVHVALDDTAGAREILRQARGILQKRPDLGVLPKMANELETMLDTMRTGKVGATSLTAAELRLLPFLPTHLTYPQVAARLHVSRNTIKSQAISIYQKLGVSSRAEAIERLLDIGLLRA